MTQGQNFVLIGGHTEAAFINMSQIALWSLPEESWSFQTVGSTSSSSNPNTELAVKSTVTSVDSRSGHTAVLTEDGSQIIVLGGWVGDLTQAANPQLVVLNVASGFGGTGDWSWSVPNDQPSGSGMYGHGAVMLPGNVMMVIGGYNISGSASNKRDVRSGTQVMFLNTTSMNWISNYTNPAYVTASFKTTSSSSSSNTNAKKIGLGAGLGIGFAAILGALIVYFWYSRRLERRRVAEREKTISSLSLGASMYYYPTRQMDQTGGGFPWSYGRWNRNSADQDGYLQESTNAVAGYENLDVGVHALGDNGHVPPPPRQIPRKPLKSRIARGLYQPTPNPDFISAGAHGRANSLGTAGPIHPIYEADEDDSFLPPLDTGVELALGDPSSALGSSNPTPHSDPFRDPPAITYSGSLRRDNLSLMTNETESPAQSREREIQEWVSAWAAADALLQSQAKSHSQAGRLSPTRRAQLIAASNVSSVSGEEDSGRTASNLSERSIAASATVSHSGSSSQGRSRSNSLRGFISNAMHPFTSTILSTTVTTTTTSPVFDAPGRLKTHRPPGSSGSGSSSFTTARTSFPALQAEGENLLPRPASGESSPTRSLPDSGGSPSKSKTSALGKGRQIGWLGSLKKGFFGGELGSATSSQTSHLLSNTSRDTSPVRVGDSGSPPRRTVSAGATLWRRKQGRGDWEDSADFNPGMSRSNTITGDLLGHSLGPGSAVRDDDDEWDIERAVQNRVVQVMFTVPKEKLRVVNHNVEDDGSETGSLRSKKGSNKSLREAEPEPSLEPVGEVETPVERPSTPEGEGKRKSKVLEIVEKLEERSRENGPER
jgi:hypothetical protein